MPEVSVAEARNALTRLIYEVESGQVVHITRRGKPVAVLVSEEEYERFESGGSNKDFWQAIEDWRAQTSFEWLELMPDEITGHRRNRVFAYEPYIRIFAQNPDEPLDTG